MISAFPEGLHAYQLGQSSADCPYSKGSEQSVEWHNGFEYAADLQRDYAYNVVKDKELPKWEYHSQRFGPIDSESRIEELNELGNEGWELVTADNSVYTFKRSKVQ